MEFLSEPDDFGSVSGELVYRIAGSGSYETVYIEVIANGELMGVKRFINNNEIIDVNVAGYLKGCVNPAPVEAGACRFELCDDRAVIAEIRAGGIPSSEKVFVDSAVGKVVSAASGGAGAGRVGGVRQLELLSRLPSKRTLTEGEYDELSFAAGDVTMSASVTVGESGQFSIPVANAYVYKGIATLVVDAGHIAAAAKSLGKEFADCGPAHVTVMADGVVVAQVEYALRRRSSGQVRLAWVNSFGMVDYYTFAAVTEERTEAEKERLKLESGYKTVAVGRAKVDTLVSGYVAPEMAHILAEIICAEKVWRIGENGYAPVEVMTDSVATASGSLSNVTLTVRDEM